jgi:hypothetical protein
MVAWSHGTSKAPTCPKAANPKAHYSPLHSSILLIFKNFLEEGIRATMRPADANWGITQFGGNALIISEPSENLLAPYKPTRPCDHPYSKEGILPEFGGNSVRIVPLALINFLTRNRSAPTELSSELSNCITLGHLAVAFPVRRIRRTSSYRVQCGQI